MRMTLRLLLAAAAIGAPLFLAAPASANGPAAPYEEVAVARDRTAQARTTRRARREAAAQRRNRNPARHAARRTRPASRQG